MRDTVIEFVQGLRLLHHRFVLWEIICHCIILHMYGSEQKKLTFHNRFVFVHITIMML